MLVTDAFTALRAGKELSNAATWKKRQALVNALAALLVSGAGIAASLGYPLPIDANGMGIIANGVGTLAVLVFNVWATYATTTKIGLPARRDDVSGGGSIGGGDAADQGGIGLDPSADDPVPYLNDMGYRG